MTEDAPARPSARRRVRRALSSAPLRLLRKIIEDQDYGAFQSVPLSALNDDERQIYEFVARHFTRYARLPSLTTMDENRMALPEADEPLAHYRDRMRQQVLSRHAADVIVRLQEAITSGDGEAIAAALESRAEAFRDAGSQVANMATLLDRFRESINPAASVTAISLTGIPALDEQCGGLARGDLGLLYARPGVGKTFLQLTGAINKAMGGERVLFVSKEMTAEQMLHRAVTMIFDVDPQMGLSKRVSTMAYQTMMERLSDGLPERLTTNLMIVDSPDVRTPTDVAVLVREHAPDMAMIDGTYFLDPAGKMRMNSQTERLSQLVRELRSAARDTRTGVWATWQQNRGKVVGGGDDLYGTDATTQDSGLTVRLRKVPGEVNIRVAELTKVRHGPEGEKFAMTYSFKPTRVGLPAPMPERPQRGTPEGQTGQGFSAHVDRAVAGARRAHGATPRPTTTPRPHTYDMPED